VANYKRPRPGGHRRYGGRDPGRHRSGQGARGPRRSFPSRCRVPFTPSSCCRPGARLRQTLDSVPISTRRRSRSSPTSTPASTPTRPTGPASSRRSCAARSVGASPSRRSAERGATVVPPSSAPAGVLTGPGPPGHPRRPGSGGGRAQRSRQVDGHRGRHRTNGPHPPLPTRASTSYTSERVIVSPTPGVFEPDVHLGRPREHRPGRGHRRSGPVGGHRARLAAGRRRPGGHGGPHRCPHPVRRAFSVGGCAVRGERVVEGQPVAWIRTKGSTS